MEDFLRLIVPAQDNQFKETHGLVETEAKLPLGMVVVKRSRESAPVRRREYRGFFGDPVFQCRWSQNHEMKARRASRITVERVPPFLSA